MKLIIIVQTIAGAADKANRIMHLCNLLISTRSS